MTATWGCPFRLRRASEVMPISKRRESMQTVAKAMTKRVKPSFALSLRRCEFVLTIPIFSLIWKLSWTKAMALQMVRMTKGMVISRANSCRNMTMLRLAWLCERKPLVSVGQSDALVRRAPPKRDQCTKIYEASEIAEEKIFLFQIFLSKFLFFIQISLSKIKFS